MQAGPIEQSLGISIDEITLDFTLNVLREPTEAASTREPTSNTFSSPMSMGSLRL